MSTAMHAIVGIWSLAELQREDQERGLIDHVIPGVKHRPGFVSGFWMRDPETGKGHSTVVFDTEQAAREFKTAIDANRQAQARMGIVNDTLVLVEVTATTQRDTRP